MANIYHCGIISCGIISCGIISCGIISCGIISCAIISCAIISCAIISCAIISCGIISCAICIHYLHTMNASMLHTFDASPYNCGISHTLVLSPCNCGISHTLSLQPSFKCNKTGRDSRMMRRTIPHHTSGFCTASSSSILLRLCPLILSVYDPQAISSRGCAVAVWASTCCSPALPSSVGAPR